MDFKAAPCIIEAMRRRLEHGIFGYVHVPPAYYEAVVNWFAQQHSWHMKPEWIVYTTGVVPAISAIIQALTQPGDKVIVQTPVYNCFLSSIRNNRCAILPNPLIREGNTFRMDLDDLRRKASDPAAKALILCNPHNPAGRVWTREELLDLARICQEHRIFVISDEIHNELTLPGYTYTPYGTLDEDLLPTCAICTSPSKSFNIAGLHMANITAPDPAVRKLIDKSININEVCDVNPFGPEAVQAAYTPEGAQWLDELRLHLEANYRLLTSRLAEGAPSITPMKLEGTYLPLLDCTALGMPSTQLEEDILHHARLWLNAGAMYDVQENPYLRINLACTRATLDEALNRFIAYASK